MNDSKTVAKILELLREGYSQRAIAAECSVSRSAVQAYSTGRNLKHFQAERLLYFAYRSGTCPRHGKVKMPCVACGGEKYVHDHPELPWCNPLPIADDRMRRDTAEAMRTFNAVDEFLNPDQP